MDLLRQELVGASVSTTRVPTQEPTIEVVAKKLAPISLLNFYQWKCINAKKM